MVMYQNRSPSYNRFDVIDLDPYGSCSIFLDGAVQSLCDGGLLCVTSTDLTVLCGNHPEVVFTKYGANCPKTPFCHELAVRIVLYTIMMNAAKYGRSIEVLGAFQIDFYVRCFVRMYFFVCSSRFSIAMTPKPRLSSAPRTQRCSTTATTATTTSYSRWAVRTVGNGPALKGRREAGQVPPAALRGRFALSALQRRVSRGSPSRF